MLFKREKYIQWLLSSRDNGLVKIVTGMRRVGKSFLLFTLFRERLIDSGFPAEYIISFSLDDWHNRGLRNPDNFFTYLEQKATDTTEKYILLIDEVQLLEQFVEVLLSLMHDSRFDVYVTGSNSRFLSSDVVTEFRGRGDEIRVWPLTFAEYHTAIGGDVRQDWKTYTLYGGLPYVAQIAEPEKKENYLKNLVRTTYLRDIIERNKVRNDDGLREVLRIIASCIGTPTNPSRISNTFQSVAKLSVSYKTICTYIDYFKDAFLIEEGLRYDVKGRKYIGADSKFYMTDIGIRNAIVGFRQYEVTHIMENILFCELLSRGYQVDVGQVETWRVNADGSKKRVPLEVDFVLNKGAERIYIQSAFSMPDQDKLNQELRPLTTIHDSFRKIIVTQDNIPAWINEDGIQIINLFDFLLQEAPL